MISKVARPVASDETSSDVERDLARLGAVALVEAVDALAEGRATETPQDESQATYAPKIEKIDGIIDWSRSAAEIHNQVRGLHPWPHAYSELGGERVILQDGR
jgi:methionyl-tRNA formyltransferase